MNDVVIASSQEDARAADAVEQHHAEMAGALAMRTERLIGAASRGVAESAEVARRDLVAWCEAELAPHALAEEETMYPAAHATLEGRLLVDGMLAEHRVIIGLVRELSSTAEPVRAAATARALQVLFESHLAKENDQLLPLLTASPEVSVAGILAGLHELLGDAADHQGASERSHLQTGRRDCSCGEVDPPGYPELDARAIPHAIRHATIFGALDALPAGGGLVLVVPHDPVRLLAQVEERTPGAFNVNYLERGPKNWRLELVRA
ncbi:DUF2249 domain-containing protein [Actinopolymorpha sp. B11F2]|uniref:DUF2249 domain-containing protein n=1 Tax=Actinopolymorpha sp. B11F2 TaxID=3160862 RepID=UPI0032E44E22